MALSRVCTLQQAKHGGAQWEPALWRFGDRYRHARLLAPEARDIGRRKRGALLLSAKVIGYLAAALCGLETIVFAGGIDENAPVVHPRNASRNPETAGVISTDASWVTGSVTRTDEELMIARSVLSSCASINADQRKLDEH